jgi:hypothetical protein
MAALESRCRSVQNTQQAVQFYKEMFWATYRENIYPTYRLLQDQAIAKGLARDPSLQSYAHELRRSTEETYLALQTTNWQKLAEVQKQRKSNNRNSQLMDQARRYLAMEDSFITADTLPLHEKMTDDICGFLTKLHPDMSETIRLEHDLQLSKLRLQLQINQVLAKSRTAQAATPTDSRHHESSPLEVVGLLPRQPQPGMKPGSGASAAPLRPASQTTSKGP